MNLWTYRWRITHEGRLFDLALAAGSATCTSTLRNEGAILATDVQHYHREMYRLNVLSADVGGRRYRFEIGPHTMWRYGVRASVDDATFFESHPEPFAALARVQAMHGKALATRRGNGDVDLGRMKRNAPAIVTDIALGLLFFVVAKLTDLRTAALVAAGAGLALYPVQWALNRLLQRQIDLVGGLALFGVFMLLISAGFSWLFDSELAVQLKSTYLGLLAASFFGFDAARGAPYLGKRLMMYVAYNDIDPQRLA